MRPAKRPASSPVRAIVTEAAIQVIVEVKGERVVWFHTTRTRAVEWGCEESWAKVAAAEKRYVYQGEGNPLFRDVIKLLWCSEQISLRDGARARFDKVMLNTFPHLPHLPEDLPAPPTNVHFVQIIILEVM
jgi:hypothetical protein